jgi:hypothetical protein
MFSNNKFSEDDHLYVVKDASAKLRLYVGLVVFSLIELWLLKIIFIG